MSLEKLLNRMHEQINDLAPALELFLDDKVQPTVRDCEDLKTKLTRIQDTLSIYTWHKSEKELSPNFNLHAKVSEKEAFIETELESKKGSVEQESSVENVESAEARILAAISVGVNDKFRIINELFKQNSGEYNIAIEQLNALTNWNEAEVYLNSLRMIYNWNEQSEVTQLLYSLAKKRFL